MTLQFTDNVMFLCVADVLFYTGGCGGACKCPGNFCDQGGLATSLDLRSWTKYAGNPTLPCSKIRDRFDAKHRRPRSLNHIGEYWYLQYEGGSHSEIIGHNCSSIDSVGLARSKSIEGPWELHRARDCRRLH